ncbi:MAG: glycosyltransferase family 4 protein [Coriobacteriia bacterium]
MRIAWLTPLSAKTGISKYSLSAALAVSQLVGVDVWTTPREDDLPTSLPVRDLSDSSEAADLSGYDHIVYNLGNNPTMHADIFDVYVRNPGVVILHDKTMAHFMRVYYTVRHSDPRRYRDLLTYYCGAEVGARAYRQILGLEGQMGDVPLLEPCLWNAVGVVVHSPDALVLIDRYPGLVPVTSIDLPFYLPTNSTEPSAHRASLGINSNDVLVVSHGRIGESKRIDQTVRALSLLPVAARERVQFVIVGGAHPAAVERVLSQARALGLGDHVRITGFLPEAELHAWLRAADIFINLRFPSTESGSGSLVEQLAYPAPIVVSDIGFYATFPQDTLVRTPPADEGEAIAEALASLVLDEDLRSRVGEKTYAYAAARFDPALYAERLVSFLGEVGLNRERLHKVDSLGAGLREVESRGVSEAVSIGIERLQSMEEAT